MLRRSSLLAFLLAALAIPIGLARPQQQPPPAPPPAQPPADQQAGKLPPIEVRLVNVIFAVTDRRNRFITNLEKNDFRVFEDGQPQKVAYFNRQTDLPLRIGLLLDTSNSIRQRLQFEQEAAIDFFYNVVRRNKDLAFLMTFDNEPEIEQEFTEDLDLLKTAVQRQRAGGGTALYDAIYTACAQRLISPPVPAGDNPELRRVLVVISDGQDNLSDHARSEAIDMAHRAGVVIYTISTSTDWLALDTATPQKIHKTPGDQVLDQLADETGGRAFFPYRVDDLAQSFQDIGSELRSQYSIGYGPPNHPLDGKFHKIRIEVDRKGLIVRARKGYYSLRASAQLAPPGKSPAN